MKTSDTLMKIYRELFKAFGPQGWWPGDGPFEVLVGAVLAQNTNWGNVERAIQNLKAAGKLSPEGLHRTKLPELAQLIRPAGYFNVKAKRLKNLIDWFFENYNGNLKEMFSEKLDPLREGLLSVKGIGRETADSILLYAGDTPSFVVDAYTYRVLSRHLLIPEDSTYEEIKSFFEDNLPKDVQLYNEYHALLVKVGKDYCKPRNPRCRECPLGELLGVPTLEG
ncbi:MAG: endonuclease [Planctomycetes bacterium RIFCSPHIGHO2_12_FULL_52_36]|nr:MAG: endonuclease [Planctomycetes bacterium RIFCSPHIGHO2_02_FULL_52_58]OHB94100.1 MAG: endonuclease [Planctomycetes bacterium RIFCSPHIGHO2_12_FULL_52_36]